MVLNNSDFKQWLKSIVNAKKYGYEWKKINQAIKDEYNFKDYSFKKSYNKVKGDIFEYLCKYALEYQGYTEVYLYNKIPYKLKTELKLNKVDKGIDGIYKNNDGKYVAFQSKWRGENKIDDLGDIAKFDNEYTQNSTMNNGLYMTNRNRVNNYQYHPTMKWFVSHDFSEIFNKNNKDFINSIINSNDKIIQRKKFKIEKLRDYQEDGVNKLLECKDSRMQCIMPCATGKTYMMFEYFRRYDTNSSVFLFPSLQLVSQTYRKFRDINPNIKTLCICSDLDIKYSFDGKKTRYKDFKSLNNDIEYTTNKEIIDNQIESNNQIVIFSTYHSSNLLKNKSFDLALYDEAHKTVNSKTFGFTLEDENCKINKRIFFTATPRIYKGKKETISGMDDEKVYGKEIYNYSFSSAINDEHILDYQVVLYSADETSPECKKLEEEKYIKEIKNENKKIKTNDFISALMIKNFIINNPKKRFNILTYHNTINNSKIFSNILKEVFSKYNINGSVFTLSGKNSICQRKEIINEFKNNKISVICSARVLNEGVDIPCVNVVVFVEPRKSTIDIVQCIGRGLRKHDDIDMCYVLLPIFYDSKINEYGYQQLQYILSALGATDETLVEYFVNRKKSVKKKKVKYNGNILEEYTENDDEIKFTTEVIEEKIRLKILERAVFSWEYNLIECKKFIDKSDRLPSQVGKTNNEKRLARFISNQKEKSKIVFLKKWNIFINSKKYHKYFETPEEKWLLKIEELKIYINKNKKLPPTKNYKSAEEKSLRNWLGDQNKYYTKNNRMFKNENIKKIWDEFKKNYYEYFLSSEEKWIIKFNKVIDFINNNNKSPSYSSKNIEEKILGSWLSKQFKSYEQKTQTFTNIKIVKIWEEKSNDDKYNFYFMNRKQKWLYKLDKVKKFIQEHKRIPKRNKNDKKEDKLGIYINTNKKKYKIGKIKKEYIKYWKNFIERYEKYIFSYKIEFDKKWNEDRDLLFEYCNKHKKVPIHNTIYNGQKIGKWLGYQKSKINSTEDDLYKKLAINKYVKKSLDEYLKNKEKNKDKVKLTQKQWIVLLFEYCNEYKEAPPTRTKYKCQNISKFLEHQKYKINSTEDELYKKLSVNKYVKESLDYYLNPDKKWNENRDLLFEYCNENKKIPSRKTRYKDKNIEDWLSTQKKKINNTEDILYKKLADNKYVKESLDKYLNRNKKWNKDRDLLFEYCNEYKKVPTKRIKYKDQNIGMWLQNQKGKINSTEDELYKKLAENPFVKESLDKYLEKKK